jgi:hypothetical protein
VSLPDDCAGYRDEDISGRSGMSIGKRVSEAIDKMEVGDPEGSLFQICAAIDVTAANEFGKTGGATYKEFVHQNLALITDIALGGRRILNLKFQFDHPGLKKSADGSVSVQEILYHVVRCGLYHEAAIPSTLEFLREAQIRAEGGVLKLPASLIYGLIIAVVVSPGNRHELAPKQGMLNIGDFPIPINKLWGRRNELLWLLDAVNEVTRLQSAATSDGHSPNASEKATDSIK